jgi:cation:H+ antiporter
MPALLAVLLFLVSLAVTLVAARLFARRLDWLGVRFGFPESLIGLLTALAADGPELSSALFALAKGANDVGVGVLVGSNGFNLAAMIGLSAFLAGRVRLARETLALEGLVGLLVTGLGAALLLRWLPPGAAAGLSALVLIPYLTLVIVGARLLDRLHAGAGRPQSALSRLARALHEHPGPERSGPESLALVHSESPTHHLLGLIVVDVALIVAGSAGMVQAALTLAGDWHIPSTVLGVLILGPLTSLPNAVTAVRLGLAERGAALVGETFNSNTINLAAGVIVPSLFVTLAAVGTLGKLQLAWLFAATLVTLALLARPGGMRRGGAAVLIVLYFAFVVGTLVGS